MLFEVICGYFRSNYSRKLVILSDKKGLKLKMSPFKEKMVL